MQMMEFSMEDILKGEVPEELKGILGQMFEAAKADREYTDPRVVRLKKMTEEGLLAGRKPNDLVREFGFNDDEMGRWAVEMGEGVASSVIERTRSTSIDTGNIASVGYILGVMQGIALERGCDGESCEHCSHLRSDARS